MSENDKKWNVAEGYPKHNNRSRITSMGSNPAQTLDLGIGFRRHGSLERPRARDKKRKREEEKEREKKRREEANGKALKGYNMPDTRRIVKVDF